jgi:hypothetical protein
MPASIQYQRQSTPPPTTPANQTHRFRTVTGNPFPRRCSCGCSRTIPRDPEIRYVVDFGAAKPYPTYLREHSPDAASYRGTPQIRELRALAAVPGFVPASQLDPGPSEDLEEKETDPEASSTPVHGHADADASPSPEAGRPWACGQLVFNAGSFESARSGFADYAKDGEAAEQLRARVNRIIFEDLEQKVLALRALHVKLRAFDAGPSFGDIVARSRPMSQGATATSR